MLSGDRRRAPEAFDQATDKNLGRACRGLYNRQLGPYRSALHNRSRQWMTIPLIPSRRSRKRASPAARKYVLQHVWSGRDETCFGGACLLSLTMPGGFALCMGAAGCCEGVVVCACVSASVFLPLIHSL